MNQLSHARLLEICAKLDRLLAAHVRIEAKLDALLAALSEEDEPEDPAVSLDGEYAGCERDPNQPL